MAITDTDILIKLTTLSGSAGNSQAQGNPNNSLGKYISTSQLSGTALNNLWDNISGDENAAEDEEYRCVAIHNNHGSLTLLGAVVWLSAEVGGGANVEIAVDDASASPIGQAGAQFDQIADESTAPGSGVGSFSAPTSKGTGLALGDIPAGYCKGVWVKRIANNTGPVDNDGYTLRVEGDTAA